MAFKKKNPTRKESQAAVEAQAPITSQSPIESARPMTSTMSLAKPSAFQQLAKVSRRMQGDATTFAKPEMLFNENYRDGLESTPFFVTKAFAFVSKGGFGDRLGLTITLLNGNLYNIALSLKPGDQKRMGMIEALAQDSTPIGPVCLVKLYLPRGGSPYYDIQPYGQKVTEEIDIPFPTEGFDDGMPF
jgi:hypothetical protein